MKSFLENAGKLKAWVARNGTNTSRLARDDIRLYNWYTNQRRKHRNGTLSDECGKILFDIGVSLTGNPISQSVLEATEARIDQLRGFECKHQHLDVPLRCKEFQGLGKWLQKLREIARKCPDDPRVLMVKDAFPDYDFAKRKTVHNDRRKQVARWKANLKRLAAYFETHGVSDIPRKPHDTDPERKFLGIFQYKQRLAYRDGNLDEWQIEALQELGMSLELRKPGPHV